jgi:hypothetical protein
MNIELPTHPNYKTLIKQWQIYKDLFTGDKTRLQAHYLVPHEFEDTTQGNTLKATRWKRTEYKNICKPFINRFASMIFAGTQDLARAIELLKEEYNNVDGKNNDFESFLRKEVARDYLLYGRVICFVNSFGVKRARPFVRVIDPLSVKDWKFSNEPDNYGDLVMIRFEYTQFESESLETESKEVTYSDIWMLQDNKVIQKIFVKKNNKWERKDEFTIDKLEQIPFVLFDTETRMQDGAPILISRYNLESSLDNQVLYQALQKIMIVGRVDEGTSAVWSEGAMTVINGEATVTVVEPSDPIALERRVNSKGNDFFQVMFNQTRNLPTDAKGIESAETIRAQKDEFLKEVESCAKDLTLIANHVLYIMAKFKGLELDIQNDGIVIGNDLNTETIDQHVMLAKAFMSEMGEKWKKATNKKIARMQDLPEIDEVIDEIENQPAKTTIEAQPNRLQTLLNG